MMARIKLGVRAAVTALSLLLVTGAGASARTLTLDYHVHELRPGAQFSVTYRTGVKGSSGGFALTHGGGIAWIALVDNAIQLRAAGTDPLSATIDQFVDVGTEPVSGVAEVPSGVTVTVTNTLTGETIPLSTGAFSIPTGVVAANKKHGAERPARPRHKS
jgi:hypothetical protein